MRALRESFARWGWLPLAVLFLVAYTVESHAQEYCGEYSEDSYVAWYAQNPDAHCGGTPHWSQHGNLYPTQSDAYQGGMGMCDQRQRCINLHGGAGNFEVQTDWFQTGSDWRMVYTCNAAPFVGNTAVIRALSNTVTTTDPPPWWDAECPIPMNCPDSGTPVGGGRLTWLKSSGFDFGLHCPSGEDCSGGEGCQTATGFTTCVGDYCSGNVSYTGASGVSGGSPIPDDNPIPPNENVTCTVVGGNVHCWHKDEPDCQAVNGERWCMSDVAVRPIVTLDSQVLGLASDSPVVDALGDPVQPDSTIDTHADGSAPASVVNHYSSSTVTSNYTSGSTSGNPAQSGAPGSGNPDGSGFGSGDGDGDDGPGGSASGGEGCGSAPVCDGDPIGCALLAQAWRSRCVDDVSDDDIAAAAGEAPGTTTDSLLGELVEGDGSGHDSQGMFASYFSSQGGDWWARPGTCITDPQITLPTSFGVGTLTIELSRWCAVLAMLGQLILALSWLQALRIFVGAF